MHIFRQSTAKRKTGRILKIVAAFFILPVQIAACADEVNSTEVTRKNGRPVESIDGISSEYGYLLTGDGIKLRTIKTRPDGTSGALPGVYYIQWLSCDTIEVRTNAKDGWSEMLRGVITRSGASVMRLEKAGVGDSEGDCSALDYDTELKHHKEAFAQFLKDPGVDPAKVFIYGASMGATMAPLVADGNDVAGVIVWGGGAKTWYERHLGFDRRSMELGGTPADEIAPRMSEHAKFHTAYLLEQKSPTEIAHEDPSLGAVWNEIIGTEGDLHYGRPIAFHQQAQKQNWAAAWSRVRAPALILYGEYDWFEDLAGHVLIKDIVERSGEKATLVVMPTMDHHFAEFPDKYKAFEDRVGVANAEPVVDAIVNFLSEN